MNIKYHFLFFFFFLIPIITLNAQVFDSSWYCDYATIDDRPNGTSYNTIDVGVISENNFVALVKRDNANYLVGYANADSILGRLGVFGYGSELAGYQQEWVSGFDLVAMTQAASIAASPDSLIYVPSNDDLGKNILVFKMSADSVISTDYRIATEEDSLWAIDIDGAGHVFVTSIKDSVTPSQVLVYNSIAAGESDWLGHTSTPMTTITVPDPGTLRGIAVNDFGNLLYISNYDAKKVYCYIGDPVNGYTLFPGFNLEFNDSTITTDSTTYLKPGPWGLGFMEDKNILFVAADVSFQLSAGYEYGKMFLVNPNTGEYLDTINVAKWNFDQTGSYSNRPGGTQGNVSGYTSTYSVAFDENSNVYSQSYYGWTVEKWIYSGTLPTIDITITSIERTDNFVPNKFNLSQNYPNPFNPSTTIEFSLNEDSQINLSIYSITGELVADLVKSNFLTKGNYKFSFDASKLSSGTYIYTLKSGGKQISKKMTLIK